MPAAVIPTRIETIRIRRSSSRTIAKKAPCRGALSSQPRRAKPATQGNWGSLFVGLPRFLLGQRGDGNEIRGFRLPSAEAD
jgi:hypothetical protein